MLHSDWDLNPSTYEIFKIIKEIERVPSDIKKNLNNFIFSEITDLRVNLQATPDTDEPISPNGEKVDISLFEKYSNNDGNPGTFFRIQKGGNQINVNDISNNALRSFICIYEL